MTLMVLVQCDYTTLPHIQFTLYLYISNQSFAIEGSKLMMYAENGFINTEFEE